MPSRKLVTSLAACALVLNGTANARTSISSLEARIAALEAQVDTLSAASASATPVFFTSETLPDLQASSTTGFADLYNLTIPADRVYAIRSFLITAQWNTNSLEMRIFRNDEYLTSLYGNNVGTHAFSRVPYLFKGGDRLRIDAITTHHINNCGSSTPCAFRLQNLVFDIGMYPR